MFFILRIFLTPDRDLWPMTLIYELDLLHRINLNRRSKYLGRSFLVLCLILHFPPRAVWSFKFRSHNFRSNCFCSRPPGLFLRPSLYIPSHCLSVVYRFLGSGCFGPLFARLEPPWTKKRGIGRSRSCIIVIRHHWSVSSLATTDTAVNTRPARTGSLMSPLLTADWLVAMATEDAG